MCYSSIWVTETYQLSKRFKDQWSCDILQPPGLNSPRIFWTIQIIRASWRFTVKPRHIKGVWEAWYKDTCLTLFKEHVPKLCRRGISLSFPLKKASFRADAHLFYYLIKILTSAMMIFPITFLSCTGSRYLRGKRILGFLMCRSRHLPRRTCPESLWAE